MKSCERTGCGRNAANSTARFCGIRCEEQQYALPSCAWCGDPLPPSDIDALRVFCSEECYLADGGRL